MSAYPLVLLSIALGQIRKVVDPPWTVLVLAIAIYFHGREVADYAGGFFCTPYLRELQIRQNNACHCPIITML
jgi:hypothetical protein